MYKILILSGELPGFDPQPMPPPVECLREYAIDSAFDGFWVYIGLAVLLAGVVSCSSRGFYEKVGGSLDGSSPTLLFV